MQAEVISIGDELTSGQRLDTNSQWLSRELGERGVRVLYHTTVADELGANVAVFRTALERADIVVCTGGLGPTADDLTREALAEVLGRPLQLDEASLEKIRRMFAHFGREMPERNRVQALFPEGSTIIPNDHGTAPGIEVRVERQGQPPAVLFALPGVPSEMHRMWESHVAGAIAGLAGSAKLIRHRAIRCFGVGESHLESMLPDMIRRGREPSVGITASGATLTLRITAAGATDEECQAQMQPTIDEIHRCLGDLIFGEGDEFELEHAVGQLLAQQGKSLATAEWGTAGAIAARLAEVPAARRHFRAGLVAMEATRWVELLGLPAEALISVPTDSAEMAEQLAVALQWQIGADLVLAVADVPPHDPHAKEAGKLHFALATAEACLVRSGPYFGDESLRRARSPKQGLNLVRLALLRGIEGLGT